MRRLGLWSVLLLPVLIGCSGTLNYVKEKQAEARFRRYGQEVLDAYKQQALTAPVEPSAFFDLPCAKAYAQPWPKGIGGCKIIVWGQQALVELIYQATQANGYASKMIRVGQFDPSTLASDSEIKVFGQAVAKDYEAWVKTPEAEAWFKSPEGQPSTGWGGIGTCTIFSKLPFPKGVKSCIEGPGPTDGPTITVYTLDGRWFMFNADES